MASLVSYHDSSRTSNPNSIDSSRRNQKKKPSTISSRRSTSASGDGGSHAGWRSEKQQRTYSVKLIQALRQVHLSSSPVTDTSPSATRTSKAVRDAANRALAVAAGGRKIWSRAILANRIKLKFRKQKRPRPSSEAAMFIGESGRKRKPRMAVVGLKAKSLPAVQRKARVLGRLVPGCRKEPLPVILEEATDYIQALEMQIRAMSTLAELLSGSAPPPS